MLGLPLQIQHCSLQMLLGHQQQPIQICQLCLNTEDCLVLERSESCLHSRKIVRKKDLSYAPLNLFVCLPQMLKILLQALRRGLSYAMLVLVTSA